jgi:transcription elongation factor GreA
MDSSQSPSLGKAASSYLASLPPEKGEASQQAVYGFARWYGWGRPFSGVAAPEVANYAERLSLSQVNYLNNLKLVRAFLAYAKKQGWSKTNLAPHLKPKKARGRLPSPTRQNLSTTTFLTQEGYDELKAELDDLKSKRVQAIEDIRRAAADKDFRENAPLEAAREERGRLEGRILELEEALKSATIMEDTQRVALKISMGDSIVLRDQASGDELHYTIVSPREADPAKGKISDNSPIGRAVIGRTQGEAVEIVAPVGKLRYRIERIER